MSSGQKMSRTLLRHGRADLPVGRDARQRVPTGSKAIGRVRMAQGVSRDRGVRVAQSLPLLWQESSWQVRIRVSRARGGLQPGRIPVSPDRRPAIRSGARLCEPQQASNPARIASRTLPPLPGTVLRVADPLSGARLCEPQQAGRFGDARRLRDSVGLTESPRSCGSQPRSPRVVALPRSKVCGPRRADSTRKPPIHRL